MTERAIDTTTVKLSQNDLQIPADQGVVRLQRILRSKPLLHSTV